MPLPPLSTIPPEIAAVADYEAYARERLSAPVWAYLSGGAGDELTLRENHDAFARWQILPRLLRDVSAGHTRVELLGRTFPHPVFVAPTAFHRLFHPEGESATVLGASALEAGMVVSTLASHRLEDLAPTASAPLWFQLYLQPDRAFTRDLIQRAEASGYEALVVTADAPLNGLRHREQRAGFQLPPGIEAVNLRDMPPPAPATSVFGSSLLNHAPRWKDLAWVREQTRLPVLLKGVLAPADARIAVEEGLSGIVVSNHGGRTLDSAPATLDALPRVAAEAAGKIPVLMDGGIRRGSDIFKAIALGADAVMVGRPVLHGLAAAGAVGVAHVLRMLRTELELTMALAGCPDLSSISRDFLWRA